MSLGAVSSATPIVRLHAPRCPFLRRPPPGASVLGVSSSPTRLDRLLLPRRPFAPTPARTMPRAAASAPLGSTKSVLIPIANGSEEMEAVIMVDVLVRAGADVTLASVEDSPLVVCSRGVQITADCTLDALLGAGSSNQRGDAPPPPTFDLIALPGGMPGAQRLADSDALTVLLHDHARRKGSYAAICAAPAVVLHKHGLLRAELTKRRRRATAHPAFIDRLDGDGDGPGDGPGHRTKSGREVNREVKDMGREERVVVDGPVTTSRGPGTAFEFALSLVAQLFGTEKAMEVAGPMVLFPGTHESFLTSLEGRG